MVNVVALESLSFKTKWIVVGFFGVFILIAHFTLTFLCILNVL